MSEAELLAQLAEECMELAHAALKLRRVLDGKNPTPVSEEKARENFNEEVADVNLVLAVLGTTEGVAKAYERMNFKLKRWAGRLRANWEGLT